MAKVKNKKRSSSDKVHAKKEKLNTKKSLNPFEVHINKEKIRVVGQKRKNDRGLPGVSRGKAIEKRKRTLLQEYKIQNKSNQFMDKRIGERNGKLSEDDKVMARFTAVRIKAHNKKSIYNLADDEVLTHKGQTLSEIEKFDDPRSDDEDSFEGNSGKLDKDFVEEAHFGGGVLRNTGREGATSHKDLINQLIAESKKRKAEKQQIKEETLELTEKLDTEWKDLIPLVNTNKSNDEEMPKQKMDDYDKIMRELRFEARGTVSDRLKTEDEIAKEEKEKLEQLEKERLERMKGIFTDENSKPTHRSADDLDDGIFYEEITDDNCMLSYNKEGEANMQIDAQLNGKEIKIDNEKDDKEDEDENGNESSSDEDMETESEDSFADLKEESSESEEEVDGDAQDPEKVIEINDELTDPKEPSNDGSENKTPTTTERQQNIPPRDLQDKIKQDLLKRKELMEQARNELPFTFSLPDTYESLLKLLENQPSHHQGNITICSGIEIE
ncbi:unnamed protein product [Acanthoscelides obtectus]|uniref:Nucleolar protein 14 n=1 Tax=Acanthoscelides obtectus TaxID=200917 RepID=A0A9P0PRZ6_ACAOB|nr:unnamed protein product [Acanthoscelides obtectus]CAK1668236.1 Nucleolar protein 14 [Acanthoscelides obtectus]